ncbi:hypothetical protein JIX55_48570 [Streptomyces sp. DSM 40750]|nr:hypothetical protein [Streptomyces sp. DSM 40750]UUU27439.1 hypothetical protein JIX55_48570 [Streptomyces sp. DSM 40750]
MRHSQAAEPGGFPDRAGAVGMSHGYTDSGTGEAESIRSPHRVLEAAVTVRKPNEAAAAAHERLFPGHVSSLAVTDPELIELFDNQAVSR